MTLPSLMVKKRNMELESSFKTAYSTISQAVLRMSVDNTNIQETYCAPDPDKYLSGRYSYDFIRDFSKYFQVIKLYDKNTVNLQDIGYKETNFTQANGYEKFNADSHNEGAFFTKNGMMIASSGCWWDGSFAPVDFIVDTNGIKGPNRFGYDIFYFQINEKNILLPSTIKYTFAFETSQMKVCCDFINPGETCHKSGDNGTACSHFAIKNLNPADETKPYWKSLH